MPRPAPRCVARSHLLVLTVQRPTDRKGKGKAQVSPEVLFSIRAQIRTMIAAQKPATNGIAPTAAATPPKAASRSVSNPTSDADIERLMRTVGCSRAAAIKSLRERNGDVRAGHEETR